MLCMLVLLGPGCSTDQETANLPPAAEVKAPPVASPFQQELDRLGVPLRLPARGKAIVVNIPAFELIAFRDGMPELRSRVIVGSPRNPTPVVETHVSAVRFRPRWRPTPSMIASGEYADKIWPPGRKNPLGLAAIRLGEGFLIYLHDTNRRSLFEREARALSHGCIRVQRWDELIGWVLDIDLDEVHRHANGRRTFDVQADPIPVYLGYFLRFPQGDGAVAEFADVYRLGTSLGPQRDATYAASDATCAGG
ncbi:L,D-transpeptidase family protein [Limibaculum sp. M0105]|uniref:L,D-transpeptidase family protein n=2 Tax=Thermohalobaculum xanthum TaxID=2753746 RepID=A0A8J7SCB0_9RHOB|nr:L,D-transpeptidase family protein [Thermohalobaculum xanthum]